MSVHEIVMTWLQGFMDDVEDGRHSNHFLSKQAPRKTMGNSYGSRNFCSRNTRQNKNQGLLWFLLRLILKGKVYVRSLVFHGFLMENPWRIHEEEGFTPRSVTLTLLWLQEVVNWRILLDEIYSLLGGLFRKLIGAEEWMEWCKDSIKEEESHSKNFEGGKNHKKALYSHTFALEKGSWQIDSSSDLSLQFQAKKYFSTNTLNLSK